MLKGYSLGIPCRPKKCCGKNVRLTPMKSNQNWAFDKPRLKFRPKNFGTQKYHPLNMANTAPILKT